MILYYSLRQLTQLEMLNIGMNTLNTVPDVVSSLTSLKQLYMKRCGISSLPERFVCHMFIINSKHYHYLPLNYICTQLIAGMFNLFRARAIERDDHIAKIELGGGATEPVSFKLFVPSFYGILHNKGCILCIACVLPRMHPDYLADFNRYGPFEVIYIYR